MMSTELALDIDWSRTAWPQADGYDTQAILELSGWRPRPVGDAPSLFGGRVAVRHRAEGGLPGPKYQPAPLDHTNLAEAERILGAWPEALAQAGALLDEIQPWIDTSIPENARAIPGSSSHSEGDEFGTIMLTADHPFGTAQAIVHEMAHHKLRALGVQIMSASRIVGNDPAARYTSPIITDRKRPMTAVLHAQYSFMHVTVLDVAVYNAMPALREQAVFLLSRNVPRMEGGREEIAEHLEIADAAGEAFMDAFNRWSDATLAAGRAILDAEGYGLPEL
ncbi:HEXXH motif-containing putative peptide modification protein [Sphingomonas sp. HITSZ_GF]|uniref:aKG-HExxH-type peptide beta-hydroxylase n=1 Tax=Sphingomonas sp. HITSZ_GF TaxID=3037247 RepID=UPI00240D4015|nr:HEXXH motif-containing putative peptide modification protein [Sphingomonas sp. HITSZ_GF]MDG2534131.1 HEXXH motif-containing putative peptide modification protein [Sphingomonas sp. HITSZ_GF]